MCSIVLRVGPDGVLVGANRDEMVARPWRPPAAYWADYPGVVGGRDDLAGGTWMALGPHGVMAAVLNRQGTLGPVAGKRSRGELPLLAAGAADAADAVAWLAGVDAGLYRSFNLVIADRLGGWLLQGVEAGTPTVQALGAGTWMVTSGAANDLGDARIARHLPRFREAVFGDWTALLGDAAGPRAEALNISAEAGFGTVCSSVLALPVAGVARWWFAGGAPDRAAFEDVGSGGG